MELEPSPLIYLNSNPWYIMFHWLDSKQVLENLEILKNGKVNNMDLDFLEYGYLLIKVLEKQW